MGTEAWKKVIIQLSYLTYIDSSHSVLSTQSLLKKVCSQNPCAEIFSLQLVDTGESSAILQIYLANRKCL